LTQQGILATDPVSVLSHPGLGAACGLVAERARHHFEHADEIMARSPRRIVRAPRLMAEVYKVKLDQLIARGWSHPRKPIKIGRMRLLWTLARYAVI
jgi:phytoene synthase